MRSAVLIALVACSSPPAASVKPKVTACADLDVVPLPQAIAPDHPCRDWVEQVRGRVGRQAMVGSFVVVSTRTASGVGLVATAHHTLGAQYFGGALGADLAPLFQAPKREGVLRFHVVPASGDVVTKQLSPFYPIFHRGLSAAENEHKLTRILPIHDIAVGIVDGQRLQADYGMAPVPAPRADLPVKLYAPKPPPDPPWAEPAPGSAAIVVGYPTGSNDGAISVGKILTEAEIADVAAKLRTAKDEEGALPHDPAIEAWIDVETVPGMSGGGVFDGEGRLLGIMVRGSSEPGAPKITRFIKATTIVGWLREASAGAPDVAATVQPYLDPAMR